MKEVLSYVGAAVAIIFGVALLWFPPDNIGGQPGTVGAAFAFVTGGLAALGVTITLPFVRDAGMRMGYSRGHADGRAGKQPEM